MGLNYKKSDYFSEEFMEYISLFYTTESISESSMLSYISRLRTLCDSLRKDFLEITEVDASKFFSDLKYSCAAKKKKDSSVYSKWACYSRVAEYIVGCGGLCSNPFSNVNHTAPSHEIRLGRIPELRDVDAILSKAPNATYYLVFVLAYRTALSLDDIVTLCKSSIIQNDDHVYVQLKKGRLIPLPEDVASMLLKHLCNMTYMDEAGHLFYNQYGNALNGVNVRQCFCNILKRLNLDSTYSIKDLRNRCILDMIAASEDAGESTSIVGDYVGLGEKRLRTVEKASIYIKHSTADLVNIRVNNYMG